MIVFCHFIYHCEWDLWHLVFVCVCVGARRLYRSLWLWHGFWYHFFSLLLLFFRFIFSRMSIGHKLMLTCNSINWAIKRRPLWKGENCNYCRIRVCPGTIVPLVCIPAVQSIHWRSTTIRKRNPLPPIRSSVFVMPLLPLVCSICLCAITMFYNIARRTERAPIRLAVFGCLCRICEWHILQTVLIAQIHVQPVSSCCERNCIQFIFVQIRKGDVQ